MNTTCQKKDTITPPRQHTPHHTPPPPPPPHPTPPHPIVPVVRFVDGGKLPIL